MRSGAGPICVHWPPTIPLGTAWAPPGASGTLVAAFIWISCSTPCRHKSGRTRPCSSVCASRNWRCRSSRRSSFVGRLVCGPDTDCGSPDVGASSNVPTTTPTERYRRRALVRTATWSAATRIVSVGGHEERSEARARRTVTSRRRTGQIVWRKPSDRARSCQYQKGHLCKIFHTPHRTHDRAKGGLLQRANRKTDLVQMLDRDLGPEDDGCEAERLAERVHVDGRHRTANGGRRAGAGPVQVRAWLRSIYCLEKLGEMDGFDGRPGW